MSEYILARGNGRTIPHEDKIFGISNRAKAMIAEKGADKVINATIGSLLDDNGDLVVLSSGEEVFKHLSPKDYADYAPIEADRAAKAQISVVEDDYVVLIISEDNATVLSYVKSFFKN